MKKFLKEIDPNYLKIASLACLTSLVTFFLGYWVYNSLPGISTFWNLCVAVLKPMIVGGVIAYLLLPLVHAMEKWVRKIFPKAGWVRLVCVLAAFVLIIGAIVILVVLLSQKLVTNINIDSIKTLLETYETQLNELLDKAREYLEQMNINFPNIGKMLGGAVGSLAGGFSTLLFGIIFCIYYLTDGDRLFGYWGNVLHKLLSPKTIAKCKELLGDADKCFSGYIRGQTLDAIIVGVVVTVAFTLVKMPYAAVVGFLCGFGNLIPYFGPTIGYIAVVLVNVINGVNIPMMAIGLIILEVIQLIDGNIINPRLLAGAIQVHPLLVVASLLAGGAIGGILGMLLAVPVGAFLKMQFDKWLARKKVKTEEDNEEEDEDDE